MQPKRRQVHLHHIKISSTLCCAHTHTKRVMEHLIRTANSMVSFHPHSNHLTCSKGGNARLLSSGSTAAICHYSNCFVPITYGSDCCSRTAKRHTIAICGYCGCCGRKVGKCKMVVNRVYRDHQDSVQLNTIFYRTC